MLSSKGRFGFFPALAVAALVAGCGGHGHSLLPSSSGAGNALKAALGSTVGTAARRLVFNVNAAGWSPDNAYRIRSLHFPGVRVHESLSYLTPNGAFTQIDYATPYGMLTLVQSPSRPAPIARVPAPSPVSGGIVQVIANGRTQYGGDWVVLRDPSGNAYDIQVAFKHSVIDASVPLSVPISTIQTVIGGIY